jgi:hypothetical protein
VKLLDSKRDIERAARLVLECGVSYILYNGKSCSLRVYSPNQVDLYHLSRTFGGNFYKHRPDKPDYPFYVWAISKRKDLLYVYEQVLPFIGEEPRTELSTFLDYCETVLRTNL